MSIRGNTPRHDPDRTIVIRPRRRGRHGLAWIAAVTLAVAGAVGGALWTRLPAPPSQEAARLPPLMVEADILARAPAVPEAYRFAPAPAIVVLQFPDLATQGATLNRVAAYIEKAGFPRDRILADAELDRRIRETGDTPATFYYGHDYRAADLVRFFDTAARQGVLLTPSEVRLRQEVAGWGWQAGTVAALITLVREDPPMQVDQSSRATILRHELSHGLYFTDPAYAAYVAKFWSTTLTEPERAAMRAFLGREGYDLGLSDLVMNESQAYLFHTADDRYFAPDSAGFSAGRIAVLRHDFLASMPAGWLRQAALAVSPVRLKSPN